MTPRLSCLPIIALWVVGCAGDAAPNGNDPSDLCPEGTASAVSTVSYVEDIHPLLSGKGCLSAGCHGGLLPASAFDLTEYSTSFGPGAEAEMLGACNIVPGDAEASYLLEKLGATPRLGARMPLLRSPLTEEEIELIATWIRDGAPNN